MLIQIQDRKEFQKRLHRASVAAGHEIQAEKYAVLADRAQKMEEAVLEHTSPGSPGALESPQRRVDEGAPR